MAKQYSINWKQSDYIRLGKAVSNFNKKINEVTNITNKLYLPELQNYKILKQDIKTRNELNRIINSLKRFTQEGAEELYKTQSGEIITKWERKELGILSRTAQTRLKAELKQLYEPTETGYSKAQMGSIRVKEIEAQLKNLKKIETKSGYEFKRLKKSIQLQGRSDYEFRKAEIYRLNFMKELKNLANTNEDFKKVYDYFNKIKNPITFFETSQRSNALQDFFEWYNNPTDYASFTTTEDLADYIINEYQ